MIPNDRHLRFPKIHRLSLAAAIALSFAPAAQAAEIGTGNPDVVVRWDNTIRYNLGIRTEKQDGAILANPNYDDGDRNFDRNSLVANRLDLLSEFDVTVRDSFGFRVSGTAWYDHAYQSLDNRNAATANTLDDGGAPVAGELSSYADRYARGASGELLDAFVFAHGDIGSVPVSLRAGRHTAYWGESLFGGGAIHGISYGQYSLDLWKALATPGIEAKELFRPRTSVTLQVQPTTQLTIGLQAFFDWEEARYPESGSYLTVNDALLRGGDSLVIGPGQRLLAGDIHEPKKHGDWGLMARWSPEWLGGGTTGLYVRRATDIQPQLTVTPAVAAVPAATCSAVGLTPLAPNTCYINPAAASVPQILAGQVGRYDVYFGQDIDIYGWSLSRQVGSLSLGAELSYRRNMPLQSVPVTVLPAPLVNRAAGQVAIDDLDGNAPGARGNTLHGVVNLLGLVSETPLFDSASWGAELAWNRWDKVTHNPGAFKGSAAYRGNPANIDAVSKDYFGINLTFTPTWYQVMPGVDLSMPTAWSAGLSGNSAVLSGGNEQAGSFSVGIAADIQARHNVALRYVGFYGDYTRTASGAMNVPNGTNAVLSDRDHVLLTYKTTF
ncbi:hypothetical protein GCM10027084_29650 [Pseudoxanthomonas sangjuensis]|uniref:DUF1302 domain-containing protein n=1 Tax=Pseudoxanthomonas sangjuensis TaxID=1503750 RepID=UPI0013913FF7|nr:DUF1302 domain-containing protein [Pseudoxanthomonas sangjuensis]KAF1708742.1 hypothetical protein CSC71_11175 [Pseudoxanthomonas sangjuensis]